MVNLDEMPLQKTTRPRRFKTLTLYYFSYFKLKFTVMTNVKLLGFGTLSQMQMQIRRSFSLILRRF